MHMLYIDFAKKTFILFLFLNSGLCATLNESFIFLQNESYYEFSNDLNASSMINIAQDNIIINGLKHSFIGGFNVESKNLTLINIRFKSYNDSLIINNSQVSIINCSFENVTNALKIIDSNFSLINNNFSNIDNLIKINAGIFLANISGNELSNVKNHFLINSTYKLIDRAITLNNEYSNFYDLFKIFFKDSNNYFNNKQYLFFNNLIYAVANDFQELTESLLIYDNVAIGSNITANKALIISNDANILGQNNYFISNINRDYAIVTIGDIKVSIDSLNLASDSNTLLSNMGSNVTINNSNFYPKIKGYYQLEGNSHLINSNFHFLNNSDKTIGAYFESGSANVSNVNFYGASTGLLALSDSIINGFKPECVNHSLYKVMQNNIYSLFLSDSSIIPKKSFIYGKEYDYYEGIVVNDLEKSSLCAYPGFLKNDKYPWEEEFELIFQGVKNSLKLFSRSPDSALGKLNFIDSYENCSIKYSSTTPSLLNNEGKVFNPFLNSGIASIDINISRDDLWINYPMSLLVLPIVPINSSRVISNGVFQNNDLFLVNEYELDSNNSIIKWPGIEKIKIEPFFNSTLVLKKNGETIQVSLIEGYYEININPFNIQGIISNLTEDYDFYWLINDEVFLIERLNVKSINNVKIIMGNQSFSYLGQVTKIIFEQINDYESNFIDFSNFINDNVLMLESKLFLEKNLGNIVSIILPKNIYSKNYWDGRFLMPALIPNPELSYGKVFFSFKTGNEFIDLYSDEEFIIKISGFSGFSAAFENSTGIYKFDEKDYYDESGGLVIKTKHLSNFFIYEENKIVPEQEILVENEVLIEDFNETQALSVELQPVTGLITFSSITQKDFLTILRVLLSILMIFAAVFIAKKNYFSIKK